MRRRALGILAAALAVAFASLATPIPAAGEEPSSRHPKVDRALYATEGLADEHLIIGSSSTQLTYSLFVALLDPGDSVLLFDPSYANYVPQLMLCQDRVRVHHLPVFDPGPWSFFEDTESILASLEETLARERPRVLLFSSPDNPTGQVVQGDDLASYVETARDHGCALISDEFYSHFIYTADSEPGDGPVSAA